MKRTRYSRYLPVAIFETLFVLGSLLLFCVPAPAATQQYQYGNLCNDCHGMPPIDAAYRNVTTGGFKGSHSTHNPPSVAPQTACEKCHSGSSGYTTDHMDTFIQMTSNINNSPHPSRGTYNKPRFFNQTSNPVMQTCANVNCHFEQTTPLWSSAPYTGTADCSACHSSPAPSTGHSKHDAYFPFAANGCTKCHADYVTGLKFVHATSAAGRGIKVALSEGSYSGSGLNYLPSQSASRTLGSCSALYCHSPGDKSSAYNAPNKPATWGTSLDCLGCHKGDAASGDAMNSASHGKHVSPAISSSVGCIKCHAATVSANTTIASRADHADKFVTIRFSNTTTAVNGTYNGADASSTAVKRAPGSSPGGACQNVYCHSDGTRATGTFTTMSTAKWGAALPTNCTACHGSDGSRPASRQMASGKHSRHIAGSSGNYVYGCTECHNVTASGNTTVANPANHVNYQVNVDFSATYGGTYSASGHKPGGATGTCNGVYCHSNGQTPAAYVNQAWSGTLGCTGCHGDAASNTLSGKHQAHVNNAAIIGVNFGCVDCHAKTVSDNSTISTYANHVNKFKDYSGVKAGGSSTYVANSCSSTYCHTSGKKGIVPGGNEPAAPNWTTGSLDCKGCHGKTSSKAGEPDYASVGVGLATSNSHAKHVGGASDCIRCHFKTTAAGTAIIGGSTHHLDKNIDVNLSKISTYTTYSGAYDSSARTCSATYCHGGAVTSPAWGGTTDCQTCHKASNAASGLSAGHLIHYATATVFTTYTATPGNRSSGGSYIFACSSCHPRNISSHANGPVAANSAANIYFGFSSAGRNPSWTPGGTTGTDTQGFNYTNGTGGQCNTTYCHSSGTDVDGNNATYTWATAQGTIGCKGCHNYTTASGAPIATGSHSKHISGSTYNFNCAKCHNATTTDGANITDKTKHVNKTKDVAWDATNSDGSAYAAPNCTNIYCHSTGTANAAPYTAPNQAANWGSSLNTNCTGCHKSDSTSGDPMATGSHTKHVSTFNTINCVKCHAATVTSGMAIGTFSNHVNSLVNVAFNNTTTAVNGRYNGALSPTTKAPGSAYGSCENVYCHSTVQGNGGVGAPTYKTPTWGSAATGGCGKCHDVDASHNFAGPEISSGSHTKHLDYNSMTSSKPVKCTMCHNWTGGPFNATCTTQCHSATATKHANHQIDIIIPSYFGASAVYNGSPNPGSGYSTCSNTYCHSDGTAAATGTVTANTTVSWGTAGPLACNSCHGNSTYSDYRKGAPLYASGSPKGNAHQLHIDARTTASDEPQCLNCHNGTTTTNTTIASQVLHVNKAYDAAAGGTYRDGDNVGGAAVTVTVNYTYNAGGSSCNTVSCHPTGLGDANKAATVAYWNNNYQCTDCHKIDLVNTSGYHHAMRSYSGSAAAYPTSVPQGDATSGTNSNSRRCTMCHVDHNIFSPMLNTNSNARANNLRTDITVTPTATGGYTNSDYIGTSGGTGGICITCHTTELTKSTTRILTETSSTKTAAIPFTSYSGSAHEYAIASTMNGPNGGTFQANCSKCHNGRGSGTTLEPSVFSSMTTATHDRNVRRLYASLGANLADGNDENFCYRCHSKTGDTNPGGGPAKIVANKDYYRTATMSNAAEDIFALFAKTYKHNVAGYTGLHKPAAYDETLQYISANKHVECADCHNPHAARAGNHNAGNAALAKALKGATGVQVTWNSNNWTAPTYTAATSPLPEATAEYQICFKCHSGANTNPAGWNSANTSWTSTTAATAWTDVGLEFSPNNGAGHPIVTGLNNYPNSVAPKALVAGQLTAAWSDVGNQVMTCSDCHATDSTASAGPHGSSVKWMLKGPNTAWPYTSAANNGTSSGTYWQRQDIATGAIFCKNCHPMTSNQNPGHSDSNHNGYKCVTCHIRVPHGGKVSRLILTTNAPGRYYADGNGAAQSTPMSSFRKAAPGSYGKGKCSDTCSSSDHPAVAPTGTVQAW